MILTRNLHMFQDNLEPKVENKNLSLEKTGKPVWSQILRKMALTWPHKIIKKNISKKYQKLESVNNLWRLLRPQ